MEVIMVVEFTCLRLIHKTCNMLVTRHISMCWTNDTKKTFFCRLNTTFKIMTYFIVNTKSNMSNTLSLDLMYHEMTNTSCNPYRTHARCQWKFFMATIGH